MNHAMTIDYGQRALKIATDVKVSAAFDAIRLPGMQHPPFEQCSAIWDTGAMSSVVTPAIARKLNLKSLGVVRMQHANGESLVNTYMINLMLPNKMEIQSLYVMEGDMADTDVLIGMDVITCCDFAITNPGSKTLFSFDAPSIHVTDYTKM